MTPRGGIRPWRGERAGGGARGAQRRLSALRPRAERRVAAGTPASVVEAYARIVGSRSHRRQAVEIPHSGGGTCSTVDPESRHADVPRTEVRVAEHQPDGPVAVLSVVA